MAPAEFRLPAQQGAERCWALHSPGGRLQVEVVNVIGSDVEVGWSTTFFFGPSKGESPDRCGIHPRPC